VHLLHVQDVEVVIGLLVLNPSVNDCDIATDHRFVVINVLRLLARCFDLPPAIVLFFVLLPDDFVIYPADVYAPEVAERALFDVLAPKYVQLVLELEGGVVATTVRDAALHENFIPRGKGLEI
jgi:hypothetical protein